MKQFNELKNDLLGDVVYARDKGHKLTAVQMKLNRVNLLIDIYNKMNARIETLEEELSDVELSVLESIGGSRAVIEKFLLVFELIGVSKTDVFRMLKKTTVDLKKIERSTSSCYDFKVHIPIEKLIMEKDLMYSDFEYFQFLLNANPEVVAKVAVDDYMRLKKVFAKAV